MDQPSTTSQSKWYVLQTKPHQEIRVLEALRSQDYKCFLPMRKGKNRGVQAPRVASWPLFPRYLFVQIPAGSFDARQLRQLQGVSGLVKLPGAYAVVPDGMIMALQSSAGSHERLSDSEIELAEFGNSSLALDRIYDMPDGDARALALVELICQPQQGALMPNRLRKAA